MVNTSDILPNTPRYLKVPLIFFNAILWILGVILIALGGYSLKQLQQVQTLVSITVPAGIIVLGVFIVVLTVVGCVVAYKEKLVGLIFYTVVMLILLIALIGVGGGSFTYRSEVPSVLQKAWVAAEATPNILGLLQYQFQCCGWATGDNSSMANATSGPGLNYCVSTNANGTVTGPCTPTFNQTTGKVIGEDWENCTTCNSTNGTTLELFFCPDTNLNEHQGDNVVLPNYPNETFNCNTRLWGIPVYECAGPGTVSAYNPKGLTGCANEITPFVEDRLYIAAVAGIVVGVIEFVCMLFSLFLIIRLCRSPRARSYD